MTVGMAMAERHLAGYLQQASVHDIVDHYTFALCGDGDLMEGVAAESHFFSWYTYSLKN